MKRYFSWKSIKLFSWKGISSEKVLNFLHEKVFSWKSIKLPHEEVFFWKSIQLSSWKRTFPEKVLNLLQEKVFLEKVSNYFMKRYLFWKSITIFLWTGTFPEKVLNFFLLAAFWHLDLPTGVLDNIFFYWQKLEKSLVEMNQTIKTWLFKRVKIYMELFQGGNSKFFLYL